MKRVRVVWTMLLLLAFSGMAFSETTRAAQQGRRYDDRDDDLQILSARYGAGKRTMDVTNRVRAQVRNRRIELQVTGDTMGGDPARGTPKILTIQYSINGRRRELSVNEGDFLRLPGRNDDRTDVLQITNARYGAGNRMMDVTNRLAAQVRNGQIELQVTGDTMGGDPARGTPKILTVQYLINGRRRELSVNEGDFLRLPGRNDDRSDVLEITNARYGAGNRMMDVTNRLAAQVRNGQIELQVTGDTMGGDPARGTPKMLIVQYSLNGRPQEVRVNEGNFLRLPGNDFDQGPPRERGRDR